MPAENGPLGQLDTEGRPGMTDERVCVHCGETITQWDWGWMVSDAASDDERGTLCPSAELAGTHQPNDDTGGES